MSVVPSMVPLCTLTKTISPMCVSTLLLNTLAMNGPEGSGLIWTSLSPSVAGIGDASSGDGMKAGIELRRNF